MQQEGFKFRLVDMIYLLKEETPSLSVIGYIDIAVRHRNGPYPTVSSGY